MVYYHKNKIPSIDDIIIARVDKISEYGINVTLIEYNNIKGFVNCSEVSRKKKVNLNKLFTVGKEVFLIVIQVDELKGYIDLSKKIVNDDDIESFTKNHKFHIQLYNIFKNMFMKLYNIEIPKFIDEDKLYNFMCETLWELQNNYENDLIIEKLLNKDNNAEILKIINYEEKNYTLEKIKSIIDEYIDTKLNRIKPFITENIKLMSYSIDGLDNIKYALNYISFENYESLKIDFDIKINYIAGSSYSIIIEQKDFDLSGSINIEEAINLIKNEIKLRSTNKSIQYQIV